MPYKMTIAEEREALRTGRIKRKPLPQQPQPFKRGMLGMVQALEALDVKKKFLSREEEKPLKEVFVTKYSQEARAYLQRSKGSHQIEKYNHAVGWWILFLGDLGHMENFLWATSRALLVMLPKPVKTGFHFIRWSKTEAWAKKEIQEGRSPYPYLGEVLQDEGLASDFQARFLVLQGKWESFLAGEKEKKEEDWKPHALKALEYFLEAEKTDPSVKVKTEKKKLQKKLQTKGEPAEEDSSVKASPKEVPEKTSEPTGEPAQA